MFPLALASVVFAATAPARTDEAQAAAILDPTQECTAYSYAPTSHLVRDTSLAPPAALSTHSIASADHPSQFLDFFQSAQYPAIWITADLSNA